MKKIGIVLSVVIITGVFIYTMSFISAQNTCTGVRIYECTALQKQQADAEAAAKLAADQLAQQQALAAAQLAQQQADLALSQQDNTQQQLQVISQQTVTPSESQDQATQAKIRDASRLKQEQAAKLAAQEKAVTLAKQKADSAAKLAAQKAADQLAQQQAAAQLAQQQADQLAQQQADAYAQQQALQSRVRVRTRAS